MKIYFNTIILLSNIKIKMPRYFVKTEDLVYRLENEGESYALLNYYGKVRSNDKVAEKLWNKAYDSLIKLKMHLYPKNKNIYKDKMKYYDDSGSEYNSDSDQDNKSNSNNILESLSDTDIVI
jgi:hypothetical protein